MDTATSTLPTDTQQATSSPPAPGPAIGSPAAVEQPEPEPVEPASVVEPANDSSTPVEPTGTE